YRPAGREDPAGGGLRGRAGRTGVPPDAGRASVRPRVHAEDRGSAGCSGSVATGETGAGDGEGGRAVLCAGSAGGVSCAPVGPVVRERCGGGGSAHGIAGAGGHGRGDSRRSVRAGSGGDTAPISLRILYYSTSNS